MVKKRNDGPRRTASKALHVMLEPAEMDLVLELQRELGDVSLRDVTRLAFDALRRQLRPDETMNVASEGGKAILRESAVADAIESLQSPDRALLVDYGMRLARLEHVVKRLVERIDG